MSEWNHLTWRGRLTAAWYPVRRLFVAPAPSDQRCWMGAPIGPHVHCPRRALPGSPWCRAHQEVKR